jgi:DNA polymerase-3 subunit epsilon
MLREIVMDTETTGLNPKAGDRLIEIGCIELIDRKPTGEEFHRFIHPEGREVHPEAEAIHGISTAFLQDKPVFSDVVDDFLEFIAGDTLVIHNAPFDIGFLNMELERIKRPTLSNDRVLDTLGLAKRKHPAGPNTLDGLCKRYGIDNSDRTKHGAIIDSLLLAEVYVELLGIRQASLGFGEDAGTTGRAAPATRKAARQRQSPLQPRLTPEDEAAHLAFVKTLGDDALWFNRTN